MQEVTTKEIMQAGRKALDWQPLFAAFKEAFEWALDVAAEFAREHPDEVAAVERVRAAIRCRIAGSLSEINLDPMRGGDHTGVRVAKELRRPIGAIAGVLDPSIKRSTPKSGERLVRDRWKRFRLLERFERSPRNDPFARILQRSLVRSCRDRLD